MDLHFSRRQDSVIDVDLGPGWDAITTTLLDSVTTRAPRGSNGINPSTYWIDQSLTVLEEGSEGAIVASGNSTEFILRGDTVVAHAQYETFEDQAIPVDELREVLKRWRAEVASNIRRV